MGEAEAALESEENKVLRAQLELGQVRQEIDRKIAEKEEEFNNTRKNHQRAMDSMQASLEAESRAKAEALRIKKKLESDINELEIALDHANKANAEAQKSIKRYQNQYREVEGALEEEHPNIPRSLRRPDLLSAKPMLSMASWRNPGPFWTPPTGARSSARWSWERPGLLSMT